MPALSNASPVPAITTSKARDAVVAGMLVLLALFALYAVFFDQGILLSSIFGDTAYDANYLHEFAHDGRHVFGLPCH
jgi:Probable cobalt transporter subunit (CbtB)